MYEVQFSSQAYKDIRKLPKPLQKRIMQKLQFYISQPDIFQFSKPLVNLPPATHRVRVGHYRIAFHTSGSTLYIDRIRHRREVYKQ